MEAIKVNGQLVIDNIKKNSISLKELWNELQSVVNNYKDAKKDFYAIAKANSYSIDFNSNSQMPIALAQKVVSEFEAYSQAEATTSQTPTQDVPKTIKISGKEYEIKTENGKNYISTDDQTDYELIFNSKDKKYYIKSEIVSSTHVWETAHQKFGKNMKDCKIMGKPSSDNKDGYIRDIYGQNFHNNETNKNRPLYYKNEFVLIPIDDAVAVTSNDIKILNSARGIIPHTTSSSKIDIVQKNTIKPIDYYAPSIIPDQEDSHSHDGPIIGSPKGKISITGTGLSRLISKNDEKRFSNWSMFDMYLNFPINIPSARWINTLSASYCVHVPKDNPLAQNYLAMELGHTENDTGFGGWNLASGFGYDVSNTTLNLFISSDYFINLDNISFMLNNQREKSFLQHIFLSIGIKNIFNIQNNFNPTITLQAGIGISPAIFSSY